MIIKVLVENTALSPEFEAEFGLCLYIETGKHKILFDVGKSNAFIRNAKKLGVNINDVDSVVISHGHVDHGGGLKSFLKHNERGQVYIHPKAFEKYYSALPNGREYIGLDRAINNCGRLIFTTERFFIDRGIEVFSNIPAESPRPLSNKTLLMENDGDIIEDTFDHEQNMIITEAGKTFLFSGCAHNGIINIIKRFNALKKRNVDYVFGGFHLYSDSAKSEEEIALIKQIGKALKSTDTKYYTCHCTGLEAYNRLKADLGNRIEYVAAGKVLKI